MKRTIVGLFNSKTQAERALREIETSGYANSEISLVIKNTPESARQINGEYAQEITGDPQINMLHDFDAFLVQAPLVELPEIGTVSSAGPLSRALMQEEQELKSALTHYGISGERSAELEQAVAEGHMLVVIQTDNSKAAKVANTLSGYGGFGVEKWSKSIDKPLHQFNAD